MLNRLHKYKKMICRKLILRKLDHYSDKNMQNFLRIRCSAELTHVSWGSSNYCRLETPPTNVHLKYILIHNNYICIWDSGKKKKRSTTQYGSILLKTCLFCITGTQCIVCFTGSHRKYDKVFSISMPNVNQTSPKNHRCLVSTRLFPCNDWNIYLLEHTV